MAPEAVARPTERVQVSDDDVAQAICRRLEFDGQQFQYGQYVAILDGHVVEVGGTFDEAQAALDRQTPDRSRGLICRVAEPVPDIIR